MFGIISATRAPGANPRDCNQAPRTELLMLDKNGQQAWMEVPAEWAAASDPQPLPGTFCDLNPPRRCILPSKENE